MTNENIWVQQNGLRIDSWFLTHLLCAFPQRFLYRMIVAFISSPAINFIHKISLSRTRFEWKLHQNSYILRNYKHQDNIFVQIQSQFACHHHDLIAHNTCNAHLLIAGTTRAKGNIQFMENTFSCFTDNNCVLESSGTVSHIVWEEPLGFEKWSSDLIVSAIWLCFRDILFTTDFWNIQT